MTRRLAVRSVAVAIVVFSLVALTIAADAVQLDDVVSRDGGYVLAAGPNVEGVVLLQQGNWPPETIEIFHNVSWLDAASIRMRWADLEPEDEKFNWLGFDRLLAEVKRYNANHAGALRTLHIRVMGGVHCPRWFDDAGVRLYDTLDPVGANRRMKPIRVPVPYDNPEFLEQLRQVYRAMYERYRDESVVTVYHGTWSAGPWDEIFHPQYDAPLPPDYTPAKFVAGMIQQLDVLIDEFCMKGKVAELPYSGKYPPKSTIDITGPLNDRIVERLGKRSPFLYVQSNGWGLTNQGVQTVSWGHEQDIRATFGRVNLALQALGTNAGGGWLPQGDWVRLVEIAKQHDTAYVELYPPDFAPLDAKHRIVEAFTQGDEQFGSQVSNPVPDFVGFRRWLKDRARTGHVRKGSVRQRFVFHGTPRRVERVVLDATVPEATQLHTRVRVHPVSGSWTPWVDSSHIPELPQATEAEVDVVLHTDDGHQTPVLRAIRLERQKN